MTQFTGKQSSQEPWSLKVWVQTPALLLVLQRWGALHGFLVRRRGPWPPRAAVVTKYRKRCEF